MEEGTRLAKVFRYYGLIENNDFRTQKVVCPLHGDINASMIVDFEKGSYHCFGCQAHGNAIDFVREIEKLTDIKACVRLAHILRSKKVEKIQRRTYAARAPAKELLIAALHRYESLPAIDWNHIDDPDVEEVRQYMNNRGFTNDTLNFARARYTYNDDYPIMFPIIQNGRFKGWVCRTTKPEIEVKRKYLNNKGFSSAATLFGEYKAGKPLVVCEGTLDMYKFTQYGVKYVVSLLKWKATPEQIRMLKKAGITHIISALDNDKYGNMGTVHLAEHFNVKRWRYLKCVKDGGDIESQAQFNKMYNKTILGGYKHGKIVNKDYEWSESKR